MKRTSEKFYAQIKAAGYEVLEATNGLEALALIQQGEIDAVISDLRMPQLDGLGLLKKVQEIEIAPPDCYYRAWLNDNGHRGQEAWCLRLYHETV